MKIRMGPASVIAVLMTLGIGALTFVIGATGADPGLLLIGVFVISPIAAVAFDRYAISPPPGPERPQPR